MTECACQTIPHELVQSFFCCETDSFDRHPERSNIPALGTILKQWFPISTQLGKFLATLKALTVFLFDAYFPASRNVIDHRTEPRTATVRRHFHHRRLTTRCDCGQTCFHRSGGGNRLVCRTMNARQRS
ncbi:hypothetical protein [Brucella anthropi]